MTKKKSRLIAPVMLIAAAAFFIYALHHPEASFPWSNAVTYILYGLYLIVMLVMAAAPFKKK